MFLSFSTAKDLKNQAEILPSGPAWKSQSISPAYPTKAAVVLYYRDSVECMQALVSSPLLQDHMQYKPFRLYDSATKVMRVYTEWLSGDAAHYMQDHMQYKPFRLYDSATKVMRVYTEWLSGDAAHYMQICNDKFYHYLDVSPRASQEKIPEGGTLIGAIISSDKTHISAQTGNRAAHPLLLSCANINMNVRNKASGHLFVLLALLPIPIYHHKKSVIRGMLENRLFHECLDIVLGPLKKVAEIGMMFADPLGNLRRCYTPIAAYIVDTPESALIAGVGALTSSVTMAMYKNFGDDFRHPPRTGASTLKSIAALEAKYDPWELEKFKEMSFELYHLNGVNRPFWLDWPLSDPSIFLTPEPLHHWHKQFWDHDVKWCINAVGAAELDFRFSVLQPRTGYRHFKEGISALKQVTGREHRNIERYVVALIAEAVSDDFVYAVRSLMDF
ncbi:hypothetical protein CVT25_005582, partial [Psilocybe cyanescens]